MRTLSNSLTATQKQESRQPYVKVEYHLDGSTWTDVSNDVLSVDQPIHAYSGQTTILLDNHSGKYNSFAQKERAVRISWGLVTPQGIEYHSAQYAPYVWIVSYGLRFELGRATLQLNCESIWAKLSRWRSDEEKTWAADTTIKDIISYILDKASITLGTSISEDTNINTDQPNFMVFKNDSGIWLIQRLLNMTECWLVPRLDQLLIKHNQDSDSNDYTYYTVPASGQHTAYSLYKQDGMYKPNKITVEYDEEGNTGSYVDPNIVETFEEFWIDHDQANEAAAIALATIMVGRAKAERRQGTFSAPMNCGQELYDIVTINNTRTGKTVSISSGRVGGLRYFYQKAYGKKAGIYNIGINVGGVYDPTDVVGGGYEGIIQESEVRPPNPPYYIPPHGLLAALMMKAMQSYNSDIAFSPKSGDEHDSLSWASGTIRFADDSTQSIDAGEELNLATGVHYIYFDLANAAPATLIETTTYSTAVGEDKGLLAKVGVSSTATEQISIRPYYAKGDNVIADDISVATLSALAADMGLLTAGEVRLGTGTPGTDFTGIRIYKSNGTYRVAGYNADVLQGYFDSDGKIKSGAGKVVMDATTGLAIEGKLLKFTDGGVTAYIYAYDTGDFLNIETVQDISFGSGDGRINFIKREGSTRCDIAPQLDSLNYLGLSDKKWHTVYRANESACPLPTTNSALDVFRKIKKPKIRKGDYGKRHYFSDKDFPDEMKFLNDKGKPDIELTRTLGVAVQAIRELILNRDSLIDRVEQLEAKQNGS